jgi:hypothetical protein
MTFHRAGAYAVRFGFDTDNVLKVGGWSIGNVAYTIWHSGNLTNNNQLSNGSGYITGINSGMVTGALGFTPYNSTNPNGYITGINSTMVTNALGFTPYNSTNPSGYITGINSTMVTNALGFTPYNSTNPSGYITSSGQAARATDANSMSSNLSTATFSFQGTTFGTMTSSNFIPISIMTKSLGSSTRYWLGVWTCTIYRTSEATLSDIYSKKDIKNIIIEGVPVYQPEVLNSIEVTQEEENFFEGVKTLFEKLTIYTYNHIGSETNQPSKIGVMAQEIEEVLESYPLLLSLLIEEVSEDIKDENDNVIDTKITKYLRTDNLDTLKTIMIKYIYFKVKNLEEAVKQANETIAKIKTVLVEKLIATEGELQ